MEKQKGDCTVEMHVSQILLPSAASKALAAEGAGQEHLLQAVSS